MKIGFIGIGGMAQAIIKGLITTKTVAPADILVHGGHAASGEKLANELGVTAMDSNVAVVQGSEQVILAVVPSLAETVLKEVRDELIKTPHTLLSVVGGLDLDQMEAWTSYDLPILRTLPNVNVEVGAGMTAVAASASLMGDPKTRAIRIFEAIGSVEEMPESKFGVFSALAGSSPAYIDLFIDALSRAGVKYGLTKAEATRIAAQATLGSAQTLLAGDKTPFDVIDQVASPGGTTVAGYLAMEKSGLIIAVIDGIDANMAKNND